MLKFSVMKKLALELSLLSSLYFLVECQRLAGMFPRHMTTQRLPMFELVAALFAYKDATFTTFGSFWLFRFGGSVSFFQYFVLLIRFNDYWLRTLLLRRRTWKGGLGLRDGSRGRRCLVVLADYVVDLGRECKRLCLVLKWKTIIVNFVEKRGSLI